MSEVDVNRWERRVEQLAAAAVFPATPEIWPAVRQGITRSTSLSPAPRLRWAAALGAVILAAGLTLFAIPPARAALYRIVRLGVVSILVEPGTATPPFTPAPAITPSPTPVPEVGAALDLQGATTLETLRDALGEAFRTPTYPSDLGGPDLVFLQSPGGPLGVMVWLDPEEPSTADLALYVLGKGAFAGKSNMRLIQETEVGGQPALWLVGPHALMLRSGDIVFRTFVSGNVLVWQEGDTTYRLETAEPLEEAVRIAESLR